MKFNLTLTTLNSVPAYSAEVEIEAPTRAKAAALALDLDFDELEWQDDLGNVTPWDEIDSTRSEVTVAA